MGCYNLGDHIAEDYIHTDKTTCNYEEPQQKYRLGTVSYRLLRGGGGGSLTTFTGFFFFFFFFPR